MKMLNDLKHQRQQQLFKKLLKQLHCQHGLLITLDPTTSEARVYTEISLKKHYDFPALLRNLANQMDDIIIREMKKT